MKLPYCEGTYFAVPLRKSGFAIGLVTRATAKGKVILCYFFGPRRMSVPKLSEIENLTPNKAISVFRLGDLFLIKGKWPIIGKSSIWKRSDWPVPQFIRRDELSRKAWRVYYADNDPNLVTREEPEQFENTSLERDAMLGAGAVEIMLTKQLC